MKLCEQGKLNVSDFFNEEKVFGVLGCLIFLRTIVLLKLLSHARGLRLYGPNFS